MIFSLVLRMNTESGYARMVEKRPTGYFVSGISVVLQLKIMTGLLELLKICRKEICSKELCYAKENSKETS